MKVNTQSKNKANPTARIQEDILQVIQKTKTPMSINAISSQSKKSSYQVKATIEILKRFGVVETIVSSGRTTLIQLKNEVSA